jgi:hypothetical protein
MAIKKSIFGSTVRKPGAYSRAVTNPQSGSNVVSNDTILFIGEADAGEGGATAGIQFFSASAYSSILSTYKSGPIVDAVKNSLAPLRLQGAGGPGRIGIYKTNASVQASLSLDNSYADIEAIEYGIGGNRITAKVIISAETKAYVEGSSALDLSGLDGLTLVIRSNGGASETVTFSSPADEDAVVSQINAQTTNLTASHAAGVLKIERDAITNHHRDGFGSSVEVVSGTALSKLKLTTGQFGTASAEQTATTTFYQSIGNITEENTIGGDILMTIGRDESDSCTAATVQVTSTQIILTATGSTSYTLTKSQYPLLKDVKDAVNNLAGWSITVPSLFLSYPSSALDNVTVGAYSEAENEPARLKGDAYAFSQLIADSALVQIDTMTAVKGLPDQLSPAVNLTGGARSHSTSAMFDAGLTKALAEDINVIVPLISQDASDDIADGETDASSTYDVEAVHLALSTHLTLRGNVKNRKEAQGVVGYRKSTKALMFAQAASLADANIQLVGQDVLVRDSSGDLAWKNPHILAAMVGGARLGVEVGEPLTYKYFGVAGIGHYVNKTTGIAAGDFDPLIDFDDAIDAGLTFLEPSRGAFRMVVDNTTYGADANFVYNRGSVVQAVQYVARTIRNDAELAFVGKKNAIADANAIKSRIRSRLDELFVAKILTASEQAPRGYNEDTFVVNLEGSTASVEVEIVPVAGMEFIQISFTLSEARQTA